MIIIAWFIERRLVRDYSNFDFFYSDKNFLNDKNAIIDFVVVYVLEIFCRSNFEYWWRIVYLTCTVLYGLGLLVVAKTLVLS